MTKPKEGKASEDHGSLQRAAKEVQRQKRLEQEWLGDTTARRPSFAEAELLDRQGIPSCHVWRIPESEAPPHLSATQALRRWQAGACAMCSASHGRLLIDHCHQTGWVRGLLCSSCNTGEGLGSSPAFAAYRGRTPALMLGVEEQYGSLWDGYGDSDDSCNKGQRNMAHVDAAEAVFAAVVPQFRS